MNKLTFIDLSHERFQRLILHTVIQKKRIHLTRLITKLDETVFSSNRPEYEKLCPIFTRRLLGHQSYIVVC